MQEWIYETEDDNSIRYIHGTVGSRTLVCIGINPSTAMPNALVVTVERVKKISNG